MNTVIGKKLYETVVKEGVKTYKEIYETTSVKDCKIEHWANAIKLYETFDKGDKATFYNIIESVIIDTVSHVLGILDGTSSLAGGGTFEFEIKLDGADTYQGLQDGFLEIVEENEKPIEI